ncbi:MAG TPA: uridine diphosphate-N-acetylglucosamine-binding protein YvcK [Thermoanaerobaculia bacterium]|nr:uridine diphosphate-N-acetylglucosamine-binding protein YvcK [Thermoanaerobaculia bacterium]
MPSTTRTSRSSASAASSAASSAAETGAGRAERPGRAGRSLVAIGGGTGLAVLLRGLKHEVGRGVRELAAVVTVSDDGGSSGRLRREFGVLPPGDVRSCIAALADDEDLLARLFQYRFTDGGGLEGHSFGNLFLTALTGITGDFYQAILTAESILSVRGKILPATLTDVELRARGRSGQVYRGESAIGKSGEAITELELRPAAAPAFPAAVKALRRADLILLGPGSLYTSILPNLLIPAIRRAIQRSPAPVVLLMNLMTQPGETDGMNGIEHLEALERHAGEGIVDKVLVNSAPLPADPLDLYQATGAVPVAVDREAFARRGIEVVEADLLAAGELIRHDPAKLAKAVVALAAPATPEAP